MQTVSGEEGTLRRGSHLTSQLPWFDTARLHLPLVFRINQCGLLIEPPRFSDFR